MPAALLEALAVRLGGPVAGVTPVGGGCIARACRVETPSGVYFVKWGGPAVARTFPAEAAGLRALHAVGSPLVVPAVRAVAPSDAGVPGFLVLEWIAPGPRGPRFWEALGHGLAVLHRHTADAYGFPEDNFIGQTLQRNTWEGRWPVFFRDHRLFPQAAQARVSGRWQRAWDRPFERLCRHLDDLLPGRPAPSLLHGDLWSGNVMAAADGAPALVDPAVYHGHREADLAMTRLFGGFDPRFYAAYREAWPPDAGEEIRRDVYNLYHLLNHLNLFGDAYAGAVGDIVFRFGQE